MKLRVTVRQTLQQYGTAEVEVKHNKHNEIMQAIGDISWHEPISLPGSTVWIHSTEEIMELGELTPKEVESIFLMRACAIARSADRPGQFSASHDHRRGDQWYFWPMGCQPDGAKLEALLDSNVIIAARKYKLWMATGSTP